jgi:hypothetical protein
MSGPTRATAVWRLGLLVSLLAGPALAAPHLALELRLDPATRAFQAQARLHDPDGLGGFALGPGFEVMSLNVDGKTTAWAPRAGQQAGWHPLPAGTRSVDLSYRATLAPLAELDHRQVLGARGAVAGVEGSFLPASAGWYPDPGRGFSYAVKLALPAGQKGLVPGDLVRETDGPEGYRAEYAFPQPAEGLDLMAGPYAVQERKLTLASGAPVRLRIWFHPELTGLAEGYLADSAAYLDRYSRGIGDYPFGLFSVVSSPTPTGFGMPSLTYLGREVVRLPFIRATSLGHEVLHNWWGNGVYPDWARGNWSEGLTTFLADYAYQEEAGPERAREMRLGWLRDLAAVAPGSDRALRDFVSRQHGADAVIGYGKSAMVFLMLRDRIGHDAFTEGLRRLWREKRFQTASWADLEAAFGQAAGRPLGDFFRQWLERPGAPDLKLVAARQAGGLLSLRLEQSGEDVLEVPVRLDHSAGSETRVVRVAGPRTETVFPVAAEVRAVTLDPDYRVWRRVAPDRLPAILREVFVAPRVALALPGAGGLAQDAARGLAGRVLEAAPEPEGADAAATLVIGQPDAVDAWLKARGLPSRPAHLAGRGSAQVWVDRDRAGRPYGVVSGRDADAFKALQRGLPHYGKQGWLVFEAGRAVDRGVGPPRPETVTVAR